jgi:hypothetical protein
LRKVSDAVREKLLRCESEMLCLSSGVLNLSAFAKQIQKEIESQTMKPVKLGTIVAALARLEQEFTAAKPIANPVNLLDIAVKSGLCEIAYEQSETNRECLQKLYALQRFSASEFFTVTHGVGELAVVTSEKLKQKVLDTFNISEASKPRLILGSLCALTLRFAEHHIDEPGQTFWLVKKVALERINIVEVISTFTELTFILHERDINKAFALFTPLLKSQP